MTVCSADDRPTFLADIEDIDRLAKELLLMMLLLVEALAMMPPAIRNCGTMVAKYLAVRRGMDGDTQIKSTLPLNGDAQIESTLPLFARSCVFGDPNSTGGRHCGCQS